MFFFFFFQLSFCNRLYFLKYSLENRKKIFNFEKKYSFKILQEWKKDKVLVLLF